MTYKQEWKPNFRFTESKKIRGKTLISSTWILLLGILSPGQTFANTDQTTFSSEELKAVVAKHFEQEVDRVAKSNQWGEYQLEYDLWVPGSANHLPKCDAKLVITGRDNQPLPVGNLKRSVSCEELTAPWRINVTIKSSVTLPVVVAATTVGRSEVVTANHLKLETRTISRSDDFYTDPKHAIGLETTRRLRAGQIVDPTNLSAPALIEKGNEIIIIASKDGFSASTKGVALEDGAKGQQIEVENLSSGRVIRAVVTGRNQVHTQF
ncbi:flagellar basal body P-ring formation chaperone FlgA [Vibrio parahaemolyticus]|uniref:flagellar basal body P-ring formation chaperone FlgA n=1 Tax=Vibrio parahaemolyticus TaxID=670 RepID=UPI000464607E|nr:flagellar basal body P-ring formation chaperone FlgA [Vibrio parahaemolyticus]ELB2120394.1 flagellar basal body P-ring formation protein FlgA [Vibrio parahaemolyticus]MBE4062581.1 flagellar basal body P-ring formation protein FlgA [Vibrio parahaemolyticus]MBE4485531.1 flagellar basal body P-ring formation protein FlgA [Vibrio parahaemolyticus]MBE4490104.1 flagellar basal body P-ring formation protein FlgA [Vibrio parahaemolyticus]MBE4500420.1 flagellar basal body P-ring formation protein Fl